MANIKFPYGVSNFEKVMAEGHVFIDKTPYITLLEHQDSFISFLRPRRIGKSLFVSILEYYYDINKKHLFNTLFSNTYIGKNPTPLANSFRILKMDFSGIDTQTNERSFQGFLFKIQSTLQAFMLKYELFDEKTRNYICSCATPAQTTTAFFEAYQQEQTDIYLIIDEYDHFTNEILLRNLKEFKSSVSQDGYVRKFYETIKIATQQGIINRFFITGVSPVTLDSLTSGFNIVKHLTHSIAFHDLMGFTEEETRYLLDLVLLDKSRLADIMDILKTWYNGYCFNPEAENTLYNSDMVLYFLDNFKYNQKYPNLMLDPNIMPDYGKLKKVFEVANFVGNIEVLEKLLNDKQIVCEQIYQFNFEQPFGKIAFINFLFYLGNLTMNGRDFTGLPIFVIPNQVIGELYWQYYAYLLQERAEFEYHDDVVKEAIYDSAKGNIQPFLLLVQKLLKTLSNRDYQRFDEKYIKVIFTAYAMQGNFYHVISERETENGGYIDMEWARRPSNYALHFQYVFELKYLKKADEEELKNMQTEAKSQLLSYLQSDTTLQSRDKQKAIAVVVVKDDVYWEEVVV